MRNRQPEIYLFNHDRQHLDCPLLLAFRDQSLKRSKQQALAELPGKNAAAKEGEGEGGYQNGIKWISENI